jgi:hypothetical protein
MCALHQQVLQQPVQNSLLGACLGCAKLLVLGTYGTAVGCEGAKTVPGTALLPGQQRWQVADHACGVLCCTTAPAVCFAPTVCCDGAVP